METINLDERITGLSLVAWERKRFSVVIRQVERAFRTKIRDMKV